MLLLRALEWASGVFVFAFITWQIAAPLLLGKPVFSLFRATDKENKGGTDTQI